MFEVVIGILSGLASAVTVAGFLWAPISSMRREIKRLETERIARMETDHQELKNRVDKHVENDCSQRILAKIETILTEQEKMDAKLDRISEDTARQAAQITANANFIQNVDNNLQNHKNSGGHHYGNN